MKTTYQTRMKWAVGLMLVPMVLFIPSMIQFFVPDLYINIYLHGSAGTSLDAVASTMPHVDDVLKAAFQGIGFSAIALHMLLWPMILIPFKKCEKWAWYTVGCSNLFLWGANTYVERTGASTFLILYSVVALAAILTSLILSHKPVFKQ